jgi:signal transduction histidine kinase
MSAIQEIPVYKYSIGNFWNNFSLTQKFVSAGGIVILCGTLISGIWVSQIIEAGVTKNAAISTALYVDSSIAPLTLKISSSGTYTSKQIKALDDILQKSPIGKRLISTKIWTKDGIIAYSQDHSLIGTKFAMTTELQDAFDGMVISNFDDLHDEEDQAERKIGIPLLEIYSPIRIPWSGEVVAVAEFYQKGVQLQKSLYQARSKSWLTVALIMFGMASMLLIIVHGGSRTINMQRKSLRERLQQVTRVARQNSQLRKRIQTSSTRMTELNEQYLKRIGADIHDGPAQLLALAALKMDNLKKDEIKTEKIEEIHALKVILDNAMKDIREISSGLTLPEIKELSLQETIDRVVTKHMELTDLPVDLSNSSLDAKATYSVKICVFRFIQEALNNAWQHAGGMGQSVMWHLNPKDFSLTIRVSDRGPGFPVQYNVSTTSGLGIEGMRERIQSMGGSLVLKNREGGGATMEMNVGLVEVGE